MTDRPLTTGEGNTAREKLRYLATGDGDFRPLTSDDAKALLAECGRLREQLDAARQALERARAYVEEPGSPGTVIETTEESATRSAALIAEIDAALAARAALGVEGPAAE